MSRGGFLSSWQSRRGLAWLFLLIGGSLLLVNLYGEARGIRVAENIPAEDLRFANDIVLSYDETLRRLMRLDGEEELAYAVRITTVIQEGLAHLDNWYAHDPDQFLQRVPFRENFLLNLLGRYSGLSQLERYHFTDYRRSFERGIGLCGDHAMIMSQLLDEQGIENELLSFPSGHVVVEARGENSTRGIFDADFGVSIVGSDRRSLEHERLITAAYGARDYSGREIAALVRIYGSRYEVFGDTYEFMRKRYVFERVSYVLKWILPLTMLVLGSLLLRFPGRRGSLRRRPAAEAVC